MAAAVKILYEKVGKNFRTTVFGITLSGAYPGTPGEVISLTSGASNPGATTVTGPSGAPVLGGARVSVAQLGGYIPQLTPTTGGTYDLSFWVSTATPAQIATAAYPASISGGVLQVEVDHGMQGL